MAKKSRMSVLKRQREARKAEKAAVKRDRREQRRVDGLQEATRDDLAAYLDVPEDEVVGEMVPSAAESQPVESQPAEPQAEAAEEPTGT